jgi:hypothetical protein
LATIYQAGADFAIGKPEEHLRLQQNLDQVTAMLYARTNFELKDPYSETLLKLPIQEGLMPDPELESQTVPDLLSFDGANEGEPVPMGEGAINGQGAKMQALSDSLAGFDALGEPMPTPTPEAVSVSVEEPQLPVLAQNATEQSIAPNQMGVAQAQTV